MQYLTEPASFHPYRLNQKISILKDNVCCAVAGDVPPLKEFLKRLRYFCASRPSVSISDMNAFLTAYQLPQSGSGVSFLLLVVEREHDGYPLGLFHRGNWTPLTTDLFGEVIAAGSGASSFLEGLQRDVTLRSGYPEDSLDRAIQRTVILIASLLAEERSILHTVKKHWGAGFEVVYFDGNKFQKLDNITYVINQGRYDAGGKVLEVPIPAVVLHYKYHGDLLVITAIAPFSGETEIADAEIIVRYKSFKVNAFVVEPLNFGQTIDLANLESKASFLSERVAMGYIIETEGGRYMPASFNVGNDLRVEYTHPSSLVITMKKEINEAIIKASEEQFPFFKKE